MFFDLQGDFMEFLAIVFVCLGVVVLSLHAIVQKKALTASVLSGNQILISQHLFGAVLLFISVPFFFRLAPVTEHSRIFWFAVAITTIANIAIQYAILRSRMLADVSLTAPIQALTPGLVTLAAFSLGEFPSRQGIVGIILMSLGTYIHCRENATSLREYFNPFSHLFLPRNFTVLHSLEQQKRVRERNALRWAYGSAILGTVGLVFDGLVSRNGNVGKGFGVENLLIALVFFAIPLQKKKPSEIGEGTALPSLVRRYKFAFLLGLLFGLHVIFFMTAFRVAPVAYIGSLKRLTIVVTVILSAWLLGEKKAKQRLWPSFVITAGAVLLAFDPSTAKIMESIEKAF